MKAPWSGSAEFSPDRRHRYLLRRERRPLVGHEHIPQRGTLCWVMLNPSTADEAVNDATMRRVLSFSEGLGYRRVEVVNLFSLASTTPKALDEEHRHGGATGPENDIAIINAAHRASRIVCAWGALPFTDAAQRRNEVVRMIGGVLWCFGTTKRGEPVHPVRLRRDAELRRWERP